VSITPSVLAISGGVGGAKLALGLQSTLPEGELAVLVNTGDDFRHLGLAVSPDLDTVLYTLAGVADNERGWGRADETWNFFHELVDRGGPTWFRLGDRDLMVHVERTRRLAAGESLTSITSDLAKRFGVESRVLPMCDAPVRTVLDTDAGSLAFQDYFVRLQCTPTVSAIAFHGASDATPNPEVLELLASGTLKTIVICPSNPWLSIDPILAVPGLREALAAASAPIVAVSPVIAGRSVKGPTAKLMRELGLVVSPASIGRHYAGLIDGFLVDDQDIDTAGTLGVSTIGANLLMESLQDKAVLAQATLAFAATLRPTRTPRRLQCVSA